MTTQTDFVTDREMMLTGAMQNIVAAYLAKNFVPLSDLPVLISGVNDALNGLGKTAVVNRAPEPKTKAEIDASVSRDGLVSFIDGKSYKTLKRHLGVNGFTPTTYRQHYGLPSDYPIISQAYSASRRDIARGIGLGKRPNLNVADLAKVAA